MQRFDKIAKQAFGQLKSTAGETVSGGGQLVIWRHQDYSQRSEGSKTASGINPEGTDFETTDHVVEAFRQPQEEEVVFRGRFSPVVGDLIITLYGDPQTEAEAEAAPASSFYRVFDVDDFEKSGELVYSRIRTTYDQQREHQK